MDKGFASDHPNRVEGSNGGIASESLGGKRHLEY
jgi:hypothetical protein